MSTINIKYVYFTCRHRFVISVFITIHRYGTGNNNNLDMMHSLLRNIIKYLLILNLKPRYKNSVNLEIGVLRCFQHHDAIKKEKLVFAM